MKLSGLIFCAIAISAQPLPHVAHLRSLTDRTLTLRQGDSFASGDIAVDLQGPPDNRPGTYGCAEAVSVPIEFTPPSGYSVHIDRIIGDLVSWPNATPTTTVRPAGVLAAFQVAPSTGYLADLNTPLYVQSHVPPSGSTRTFDYPIDATTNTITAVIASWLNEYGATIHVELTYTIRFHLEPAK